MDECSFRDLMRAAFNQSSPKESSGGRSWVAKGAQSHALEEGYFLGFAARRFSNKLVVLSVMLGT
jgi:hypothetical protein